MCPDESTVDSERHLKYRRKRPLLYNKVEDDECSAVVFVKRLAPGFEEAQLKKFFSQYGEIKNLRLIRSKKFEDPEVAQVAAESVNNYIMFETVMSAKVLPKSRVPYGLFTNYCTNLKKNFNLNLEIKRNAESAKKEPSVVKALRIAQKEMKQAKKFKKLGIKIKPYMINELKKKEK